VFQWYWWGNYFHTKILPVLLVPDPQQSINKNRLSNANSSVICQEVLPFIGFSKEKPLQMNQSTRKHVCVRFEWTKIQIIKLHFVLLCASFFVLNVRKLVLITKKNTLFRTSFAFHWPKAVLTSNKNTLFHNIFFRFNAIWKV
jgi:hypothetical protein